MDTFGFSAAQLESAGAQWTVAEILQQPGVWSDVAALIEEQSLALAKFLGPLLDRPELRIVLTGAGTSAHIGACVAPAATRALGRRVEAIATTDLVADPDTHLSPNTPTLLISFGRSGNSPESIAAVHIAEKYIRQCFHLIITCDAQGALYKYAKTSRSAYAILLPERSNDRSFAMTSSFTGMALTAAFALRALPTSVSHALAALAKQMVPDRLSLLRTLVETKFERVVYLGSKEFSALARESALKMLEMTDGKVVAIAESSLGFRHGPKTILNRNALVIVYVCNDPYTRQYDLDLVDELRRDAVAGRVIAICGRAADKQHADDIVLQTTASASNTSDLELCFPYAMFAQSLALLRAISLNVRPDNPNAAGTVSRVVKGVVIHPWPAAT
jgi:tagatose-6-phosphate ketose/aldose isomerase